MKTPELITEAPESDAPQLAIVTRIFLGRRSKKAKGEGSKSSERIASKVTRVSFTRMKQWRIPRTSPAEFETRRVEVEVLAEFEGPTGEDAARSFIALLRKGATIANGAKCIADGVIPPPSKALEGRQSNLPPHRLAA